MLACWRKDLWFKKASYTSFNVRNEVNMLLASKNLLRCSLIVVLQFHTFVVDMFNGCENNNNNKAVLGSTLYLRVCNFFVKREVLKT